MVSNYLHRILDLAISHTSYNFSVEYDKSCLKGMVCANEMHYTYFNSLYILGEGIVRANVVTET